MPSKSKAKYTSFEIVITAIVHKSGKYLITQRALTKPRFPGKWTVPGGHLEPADYMSYPKDTEHYWYNVLEKALAREVLEEVGLEIENVRYLTSLATVHTDGAPSLVISCLADYKSGEVKLQEDETGNFAWVTTEESKSHDLIGGIIEELEMADAFLTGKKVQWKKH